jgi:hypothetical protein
MAHKSGLPVIFQVLILRNTLLCRELSGPMWAAFKEIEAFYNGAGQRALFRRANLSVQVSNATRGEEPSDLAGLGNLYEPEFWSNAQGRYARTVDHQKVSKLARHLLGIGPEMRLLVVIDQELTPPPEWRYIIFDGNERDQVISIAPIDPSYWREQDSNRLQTIKHRVRTAGMTAVGEFLGFSRCDDRSCFLYRDIDAVTTLDGMTQLGPEHGIPALANCGFVARTADPAAVESVGRPPTPDRT